MCGKTFATLSLPESFKFSLWSYLKPSTFFVLGIVETSRNVSLATTHDSFSQNLTTSYFQYFINLKKNIWLLSHIDFLLDLAMIGST